MSVAADGNFPSATHKAEKNETKKKTMMAGAGDGGACGQKKVVRHAKDTAM